MPTSGNNSQGAATAVASNRSVEYVLEQATTPDKFCVALAKLFAVRPKEVAMLRLDRSLLNFLYPAELKIAGAIPVSSSTAIAAHTATTKKFEIFNNFTKVNHARIFESVKMGESEEKEIVEETASGIQKLMSAPILNPQGKVLGVIQICRKGFSTSSAGPDFTDSDLKQLKLASEIAAKRDFMSTAKG